MMRVTIEELNESTKEVEKVLVSEEIDGLYKGVGLIGIKEKSMQVFLHRLNNMELAMAISGSKELMQCAKLASLLSMVGGNTGEDKADVQ